MPIRLNLPREPYWLSMPSGVEVKVRPLTTAIFESANVRARRRARDIAAERSEGGGDLPDSPDVVGIVYQLLAEGLAIGGIIEWRGLEGDDGGPLPLVADNVGLWIRSIPSDAQAFVVEYTGPMNRLLAEGKGSRISADGTSAAGPDTAAGAWSKGSPVPRAGRSTASAARTKNTKSKRPKPMRPGT